MSAIHLSLPAFTDVSSVSLRCVRKVSTSYQGTADRDEGITGVMCSCAKKTWMELAAVEAALVTEEKMMADAEQTLGTRRKSFELAKLS
jgi:hypothetical protein